MFFTQSRLPSRDGKSLYLTPFDTNRRYLNESGIKQDVLFEKLASLNPSHVTLFIDSCYSGITRSGEAIFADARPLLVVKDNQSLPSNFTLFGASKPDEISYSSDQLGHGLFSYYLMKGLEGDAYINADGKILSSELYVFIYNPFYLILQKLFSLQSSKETVNKFLQVKESNERFCFCFHLQYPRRLFAEAVEVLSP